jgi:hypothetical protein
MQHVYPVGPSGCAPFPEKDKKLLIHGGAVHFSKDVLEVRGNMVYGETASGSSTAWVPEDRPAYLMRCCRTLDGKIVTTMNS